MQKIIFGTDGWRGLLDEELNLENIRRVGQAFSIYINQKNSKAKVAIGYDSRRNSGLFALEFGRVLMANGIDAIISTGLIPTPVLSYFTLKESCTAGVMITASHNPPQYNGIKFKTGAGAPFFTEETAKIEALIDQQVPAVTDQNPQQLDCLENYLKHLNEQIDFDLIRKAGLSVMVDSMSGAGQDIIARICHRHRIYCEGIFTKPETDFAGRIPEPIERNLQPLSEDLAVSRFSLGLATDGDGDRLGVMDEKGKWVNIQEVILYLAEYTLRKYGPMGGIVKTSSVTDKIFLLQAEGEPVTVHDVQVGFKYVSEAMYAVDALFGAEESGGFGFHNNFPDRDGIFSALMLLQMLAESGEKKLSDFLRKKRIQFGRIYYDRVDLRTSKPERHLILPAMEEDPPESIAGFRVKSVKAFKSSRGVTNGLKFYLEGNPRWLLIRISETEPLARVYAEGESKKEVEFLLKAGTKWFA
jgi:phosphomannomutase